MNETNNNPSKEELKTFVKDNFESVNELQNVTLTDWKEHFKLIDRVKDPKFKKWVYDLNQIWKSLARKMTDNIEKNPKRHSLIYVKNPFIIPGGRFKGIKA